MAPLLLEAFNHIRQCQNIPQSFLESAICPIRKAGDRSNGLKYRPTSLLQAGYKVFSSIVADRVATILPRLISNTQNGFVKDRQLQETVDTMLTVLSESYENKQESIAESPIILLIDFRKAHGALF